MLKHSAYDKKGNDQRKTKGLDFLMLMVMVMHLYTAFSIYLYIQMQFTSAYVH